MFKHFYLYLIPVLFLVFISCDFGAEDGDDLVGKWAIQRYSAFIAFKDDRTGYAESLNSLGGYFESKEFTWKVKPGSYYKVLDIGDIEYEYYFNMAKDELHVKQSGYDYFVTWFKYRDY